MRKQSRARCSKRAARCCSSTTTEHFHDLRTVQYALARQVCKLRSLHKWRPNTLMLGALGALLHGRFAVFALALRKRIETDAEEARTRKDAMLNGWTVAPANDDGDDGAE